VRTTHTVSLKEALLKELDQTFQRDFRQTLSEVLTELKIRNAIKPTANSPEAIFAAIQQSRILESKSSGDIAQMREALRRMNRGNFGLCVRCGRRIQAARLERNPLIDTCLSCSRARLSN